MTEVQLSIDWNRETLLAHCRRWVLGRVAGALILLCLPDERRRASDRGCVDRVCDVRPDGRVCVCVDSSQRRLGRLCESSATAVDKAIIQLESLGLISRGVTASRSTRLLIDTIRISDESPPPKPQPDDEFPSPPERQPRANQAPTCA